LGGTQITTSQEEKPMNKIEVFECDAEAIICGETYDVKVVSSPDEDDLCTVDIPFEGGEFVERMAIIKSNIYPRSEKAVALLMRGVINN